MACQYTGTSTPNRHLPPPAHIQTRRQSFRAQHQPIHQHTSPRTYSSFDSDLKLGSTTAVDARLRAAGFDLGSAPAFDVDFTAAFGDVTGSGLASVGVAVERVLQSHVL